MKRTLAVSALAAALVASAASPARADMGLMSSLELNSIQRGWTLNTVNEHCGPPICNPAKYGAVDGFQVWVYANNQGGQDAVYYNVWADGSRHAQATVWCYTHMFAPTSVYCPKDYL